jgi:PIN domain nuclease of toxin-antitoxin system
VRLLMDTHCLLWWANGDSHLSQRAADFIRRENVIVSAASVWEIAIKFKIGKLPSAERFVGQLPSYLAAQQFTLLPISAEHALRAGLLHGQHRDPFDRMLVAQALEENLDGIISSDEKLDGYKVKRIW